MADETKNIETVIDFIPAPYGTVFKVFLGVFDFAHSFGKTDPLDYAVARLQKQIDALVAALGAVNRRLNEHARRIAKIENERHVDKLLELNREAARISLRIAQRPTDAQERELLAFDARVLADRFLLEPDFKTHLALPSYTYTILLLLAAIDLSTPWASPPRCSSATAGRSNGTSRRSPRVPAGTTLATHRRRWPR